MTIPIRSILPILLHLGRTPVRARLSALLPLLAMLAVTTRRLLATAK